MSDRALVPAVSVVIPTYNRASQVCVAIDSALAQSVPVTEIIVSDDGSTDDTIEMIQRTYGNCKPPVRAIELARHTGLPAAARNAGTKEANGQLVAFLDSDDRWLPAKIERQVALLQKDPTLGMVCTNALLEGDSRRGDGSPYLEPRRPQPSAPALLEDNSVITSSAILRREVLVTAGGFSEDPRLRAIEDYDLWLRVAIVSRIAYLNEPLVIYRDSVAESIRGGRSRTDHWRGMLLVSARLRRFARARRAGDATLDAAIQRASFKWRLLLGRSLYADGRLVAALGVFAGAAARQPAQTAAALVRRLLGRGRDAAPRASG